MPFALLLVSFSACLAAKASCRAARKCCDGKDGDCLAEETSPNAVDEPCYCDHGCLEMGDCCPDFKDYCGGELSFFFTSSSSFSSVKGCTSLFRLAYLEVFLHPSVYSDIRP